MIGMLSELLGIVKCLLGGHLWVPISNGRFCSRCGAFNPKG